MRLLNLLRSPILLIVVLIVVFLLVQPRTQHIFFAQTKQTSLNNFVNGIEQQHDIDLASYWQFRDFYSPGSFHYDESGIPAKEETVIPFLESHQVTPQLLFASQQINSIGGRTKTHTLDITLNANDHVLFRSSSVMLAESTNEYLLFFLKPITEVKKVNGFLQKDAPADDKLGDMWFEWTAIRKN